jgi:hypothetical protein
MKRVASVLVGVVFLASSAHAAPIVISGNTSFIVNWLNSATNPDLSGQATFTISNYSTAGFDLAISNIKNTTAAVPDINARLVSFGFGLTPDATSFTNKVDGTVYKWGDTNFPGFQTVDLCGFAGQNCAGGGNDGLNQGQSLLATDLMTVTVVGSFATGVTFDPLAAKFQTAIGSFDIDGTPSRPIDVTPVPEPASLILLGSGGIAAALARRRRRKTAA